MRRDAGDAGSPRHRPAFRAAAKALALRIRRLRDARGWSQRAAATRIGVGAPVLRRLESGEANPSLAILLSVARAFGVPLNDLLERKRR
jgi:transcriptional regulator with XRE-family HTH domain